MMLRFATFAVVGGLGFITDLLIFSILLHIEAPIAWARICAFACAIQVTWLGNRHFTFNQRNTTIANQWLRFQTTALFSAIPNFLVFTSCLYLLPDTVFIHHIALVLGILTGILSNYYLSAYWVFSPPDKALSTLQKCKQSQKLL